MSAIEANSPAELRSLIEGRSDEEIELGIKQGGVRPLLDKVFTGMAEAFMPDEAAGESAVIQYDVVSGAKVFSYQLKVADGKCDVMPGSPESPRVTLALAVPDFLRLVTGLLNGQTAFFQGRLKLTGDMMFAQTLQSWFKIV